MSQIAVLFGGPAPEHDVSILTGLQACRELLRARRDVLAVYWTKSGEFCSVPADLEAESFLEGRPRAAETLSLQVGPEGGFFASARLGRARRLDIECVVLCTHGGPGEDGTLQATLDLAGVRYTGPSVQGAAIGMDKLAFRDLLFAHGVPTLERVALLRDTEQVDFPGPYIVKPRFGGSSIGIDVVGDLATARARLGANPHLAAGAVLEPYRADLHDLQIAVRTHPSLELSAIERPIRRDTGAEILDYRDKYVGSEGMASAPRELPAVLDDGFAQQLRALALHVAQLCSARGVARIDFLASDTELYVNEVNTIPGSLSRHLFVEPTVPFIELLDAMIDEARTRPTHRYDALGADGTVLRAAGAIASKLA